MSLDYRLFRILNNLVVHGHLLRGAVRFSASNAVLIFPITLVLLWIWPGDERHEVRTAVVLAALATFLALGVNQVLNHVVNRPRPYTTHQVHLLLPRSGDKSFPSDHTAVAFAVVASLWPQRKRIAVLLGSLGLLLALSRVMAGVHYPGDVLGGALVGVGCAMIVRAGRGPLGVVTGLVERPYEVIAQALRRRMPHRIREVTGRDGDSGS